MSVIMTDNELCEKISNIAEYLNAVAENISLADDVDWNDHHIGIEMEINELVNLNEDILGRIK